MSDHVYAGKPAKSPGTKSATQKDDVSRWKALLPKLREKVGTNPKDLNARFALAKALLITGAYDEALEHAKVVNQSPTEDTLELFGNIQEKREDYLEAIRAYENLLLKKPKDLDVMNRLGFVYLKAEKYDTAVEHLRTAIRLDPLFRPARDTLVLVFEQQKNNFEARIVLGDMIKIWEKDATLFTKLCRLHTIDGFFENGKVYCQRAIELDNSVPENHVYLGLVHKRTQNEAQGNNIIRSAAKRFTKSELTQWTAAQVTDETKSWEESLRFYTNGFKADPKSIRCLLGMAQAQFQLKNFAQAKIYFLKACDMDKTVRTEFAKATALLRMQKETKAYEAYKAAEIKCGAPGLQ